MAIRAANDDELMELFGLRIGSVSSADGARQELLRDYVKASFKRIKNTLRLIHDNYSVHNGRILEIGSYPFFFTSALLEFGDDEVVGVGAPDVIWPGEPYEVEKRVCPLKVRGRDHSFPYWQVNVEKDRLPFDDGHFDMVVCAEVLEHLIHDPVHMICEINRVLKPGGVLILTTPNGLYWRYIFKLAFYGTWDPYSRYGVYGRHNRLWAPSEIRALLEGNGFLVTSSRLGYAQTGKFELPVSSGYSVVRFLQDAVYLASALMVQVPIPFLAKKNGDQLYYSSRKTGPAARFCPEGIYSDNFSYNAESEGE